MAAFVAVEIGYESQKWDPNYFQVRAVHAVEMPINAWPHVGSCGCMRVSHACMSQKQESVWCGLDVNPVPAGHSISIGCRVLC